MEPGVSVLTAHSNVQKYLDIISDCESKIEELCQTVDAQGRKIENLNGQIEEKERTIDKLREEIANLRAAAISGNNRQGTPYNEPLPTIVPFVLQDESSNDIVHQTPPAANVMKSPRKPVRIDDDVIARLKNDRKAYPVVCAQALHYWQLLIDADLIDHKLKPTSRCGVTVMARIVSRMQTEVDPAISWAFFERYWKCDHLQSNLHREAYKHRKYYALVNRIFGLPDDAPYLTKSSQAV